MTVSVLVCIVCLASVRSFANESDGFVVLLRAKYTELADQLLHNQFQRALYLESDYRTVLTTPDYFALELNAEDGPLSTHDYHIRIEATPIEEGRTFLHFTYAYGFGPIIHLAMHGYLMMISRDKIGFTVTAKLSHGLPTYIQRIRRAVERNTMRYYLAIDAYLAAWTAPPEDQLEVRLQHWYNATDQYARQPHEVERDDYFAMKRREYRPQQGASKVQRGLRYTLATGIQSNLTDQSLLK